MHFVQRLQWGETALRLEIQSKEAEIRRLGNSYRAGGQPPTNSQRGGTMGGGYGVAMGGTFGGAKRKQLCADIGCSFKGYPQLDDLCPDCYKEKHPKATTDKHGNPLDDYLLI